MFFFILNIPTSCLWKSYPSFLFFIQARYTWWPDQADGLSFVPYVVTLVVGIITSGVVWSRVSVFELNRGRR